MQPVKPIWLLDVDGVINACPWDGRFPATHPLDTWHKIKQPTSHGVFAIRYSTVVIDKINELSKRAEIRWHTTWQEEALDLAEEIGLEVFPVQPARVSEKMLGYMNDSEYNWWKMQAGIDIVNIEKRPLIWTDDDLTFEWQRVLVTDKLHTDDVPTCLVKPMTDAGLTLEELNTIEQFICENESR